MDGAQYEIKMPPLKILLELRHIVPDQAELHAPADHQPRHLQMIILGIVFFRIEGQIRHGAQRVIVQMVGKADFLQARRLCRQCHVLSPVMTVEGHPAVHMKVKHFLSPPRTGGTPSAVPPLSRSAPG